MGSRCVTCKKRWGGKRTQGNTRNCPHCGYCIGSWAYDRINGKWLYYGEPIQKPREQVYEWLSHGPGALADAIAATKA